VSLIRGRFKNDINKEVSRYTASIPYDWRLYTYDIEGSLAHTKMLAKQKIIGSKDAREITHGLKAIKKEIEQNKFVFKEELEDIHMNIESRLIEIMGKAGSKLHTARSRNDQIALDLRMFVKNAIQGTITDIQTLQKALFYVADLHQNVAMPGYTHLQRAQPILLAHHFLAYFEMLQRDKERLLDCFKRTDAMPLGSGALAGVSYNIDREFVAKELGFKSITKNSIDAVSDRDFIIEYESAASICMMHISRLAEELVLWSSSEFGFIELDESFTTGSSIMPQKKNPDVAELGRGKTGRVYGNLLAMLTTMKGLPLAYNRDLQEDKEGLFDTVDNLNSTLKVFTGMINSLKVKSDVMINSLNEGYLLATDIADYLVKKGETFRKAHAAMGKLVRWAIENKKSFSEISIDEYMKYSSLFEDDVYLITAQSALEARNNIGDTSPEQVKKALKAAKIKLSKTNFV